MRLNRQGGFTLVEIMIAAGIMAVVIAGSASMFAQMHKELNRVTAKQDLASIIFDVQATIASKVSCTNALNTNQDFDLAAASAPVPPNDEAWTGGLPTTFRLSNGELLQANATTGLDNFEILVEDLRWFAASPMGAGPNPGELYYRVTLVGAFSHKRFGYGFRARQLGSAFVKIVGGKFTECFDLNPNDPSTLQNLKEMLLGDLGVCPADQSLKGFNTDATPVCEVKIPGGTCAADQTQTGITTAGLPICAAKVAGGNCPAGQSQTGITTAGAPICQTKVAGGSCPAGQTQTGMTTDGQPICAAATVAGGSCGSGQMQVGMNPDGTPMCQTAPTGVTASSCPSGQAVSGFYSNGAPICVDMGGGTTGGGGTMGSCSASGGAIVAGSQNTDGSYASGSVLQHMGTCGGYYNETCVNGTWVMTLDNSQACSN